MPIDLSDTLVVGIAATALFDLREADAFFQAQRASVTPPQLCKPTASTFSNGSGSPSPMASGWRWLEPCWSPSASSLRSLDRLLQFLSFAVVESLVRAAINIACCASSGQRLMHPFNQSGVTVTALFFRGGASKTGILRLIPCHTFFAGQDDHLEPAAWWESAGKVPYRSHSPLRRETPALIGP